MIQLTPQDRVEWHLERVCRLTASNFKKVITTTGKLSKSEKCLEFIDKIVAGVEFRNRVADGRISLEGLDEFLLQKRMADYTGDSFTGNSHTQRGNDYEPIALMALSDKIGMEIREGGICVMGDNPSGLISASPDGLIYGLSEPIEGAEVKSPCLATFNRYVIAGELPEEYALQVHGSMAVTGLNTWHFGAYFDGMPLFYVRVDRNEFTDTVERSLREFTTMAAERVQELRSKMAKLEGGAQ